ncbi:DUF5336 domain-containing protein [Actinokineospora guangxiensis]|uniref:DUF5336 domain-containing protein n=1 Tax=Actinokineospora guangxiensis TaxID=1490288 RepID=A0ABW0EHI6_9PSEU
MTYPGGAPGGYPGPGQQPPQAYGPPPTTGPKFTIAQMLHLGVAGLGVLNFFLGFADAAGGGNYFDGASLIPGFFLVAGLVSLKVILPGEDKKPGLLAPAFAVTAALTVLFGMFGFVDGTGAVLLLIFGLLQAAAAVAAFLFDTGIAKPPAPAQQVPYGQPGGYNPASGQFGQQQPHPGQAPQQPGQYGQQPPPSGQATTFAPQQGQFGQAPGTPPGGYPQQQP